MSQSCTVPDTVCFEGRGYCDETSLQCICSSGYAQSAELIEMTKCSVHVTTARSLNGLNAVLWGLGALFALAAMKVMKRRDPREEIRERKLLLLLFLFSALYFSALVQIVASEPYGARTLGNDVAVTICFCLGMCIGWTFVIVKPLVAVSGLSASVFTYSVKGKIIFGHIAPYVVLANVVVSLMPLALLHDGVDHETIVRTLNLLTGVILIFLSAFVIFSILNVRRNIRTALETVSTRDMPGYQRERLEKFARRSTVTMSVSCLTMLTGAGAYMILGAHYELATRYTWIVYPIIFIANGLWNLRHVRNNIRTSFYHKAKEFPTSSMVGDEEEVRGERANTAPPSGVPRANRSVSPFASVKKHRRLKGIKRKPLELMTAVSERTAEGTVLFTQVDGLDFTTDFTGDTERLETAIEGLTDSEERSSSSAARYSSRPVIIAPTIAESPGEENETL